MTLPSQELHKQVPCRRGDLHTHPEAGTVPGGGSQAWTHPAVLRAAGTNTNLALRSGSRRTYPLAPVHHLHITHTSRWCLNFPKAELFLNRPESPKFFGWYKNQNVVFSLGRCVSLVPGCPVAALLFLSYHCFSQGLDCELFKWRIIFYWYLSSLPLVQGLQYSSHSGTSFQMIKSVGFPPGFFILSPSSRDLTRDLPGDPVVKNPPWNAENMGLILDWGTMSPTSLKQLSLHTTTTEPVCCN